MLATTLGVDTFMAGRYCDPAIALTLVGLRSSSNSTAELREGA